MSILLFLLVLFVLILVHEFGHFVMAKKTGMRVDEFGIGFPPKLFGIRKGETEYTFNALPIGGFVKIYGEDGTDVPSSPVSNEVRDRRAETDAEAGEGGGFSADASDVSRAFSSKSKWAQAIVLIAGVTMNALFAWLLFSIAFMAGTPQLVSEEEAGPDASVYVTQVLPNSPAHDADIPSQAVVTGVRAGEEAAAELTPSALVSFIADHKGEPITISYRGSDGETAAVVTPRSGVIEADPDREAIGVSFGLVEVIREPIHIALYEGFVATITGLRDVTLGIMGLLADALTLNADLSQVAGPVGIVGLVGEASALGFTTLLVFTAFISLNLAVINLLPFPALDGGRLLFVAIEAIKGSPIRPKIAYALNATGFALLILLMVAITYNDIARLV